MEKIQLGKYKVAEKWEDVTLLQWQNYVRNASSKEDNSVDIISTLETFSDIPRSVINQMPTDLFESVIERLKWIKETPDQTPSQSVEISGETYTINVMEKLKVKEYLDLNTVIENDKFNYSMIFAILCRKQGEEYDEEFIADKLPDRLEMFEQMNCVDGMKLIAFFLTCWVELETRSRNSLVVRAIKEDAQKLVKSIRSSLKPMDYITPYRVRQILTLRKLEKSLKNI